MIFAFLGRVGDGMCNQLNGGTIGVCSVCGRPVVMRSRGRPRSFCSRTCSDVAKYYSAFIRTLNKAAISGEDARRWRSSIWADVNSELPVGRRVKGSAS